VRAAQALAQRETAARPGVFVQDGTVAFALLSLLPTAADARADEGPLVVVLQPADPAPGLDGDEVALALDLSLGDLGIRVRPGPRAAAGTDAAQRAAAAAAGRAERALAVVWYAGGGDGSAVVVHVLDLRAGRTTVEAIAIEADPDESTARALALKVRHLLRVALVERARESPQVLRLVAPILPPRPAPAPALHVSLDFVAARSPTGLRLGPGGTISASVFRSLEVSTLLAFLDQGERAIETGTTRTTEIAAAGLLDARLLAGPVTLRAGPFGRAHLLWSHGTARDGRSGADRAAVPEIGVCARSRAHVHPDLGLGASVCAGWIAARQRFLLLGEEAFDLGRFGLELRFGIVAPGV
jgi:hypothetical protein